MRGRDLDRAKASELVRRTGRELRTARVVLGLSQVSVARRAGLAQSTLSEIERGQFAADLATVFRVAGAVGLRPVLNLFPNGRIRLRNSGQLAIANLIIARAGSAWRPLLEHPIGPAPDLRAADLVFVSAQEVLDLEIERNLADLQAQLRAGMLKREAIAERYGVPVRFVLVLPDTRRLRSIVAEAPALKRVLPKGSGGVLAALRNGTTLGGDGLLWVRPRDASRLGWRHRSS
jgi:transcriptional regulator with XRE-family HTH domain